MLCNCNFFGRFFLNGLNLKFHVLLYRVENTTLEDGAAMSVQYNAEVTGTTVNSGSSRPGAR